jgi:hypothetical protein
VRYGFTARVIAVTRRVVELRPSRAVCLSTVLDFGAVARSVDAEPA